MPDKPETPPIRELDVRPLIAAGEKPFAPIAALADEIPPGGAFRLIAPFRPDPLFSVMARKGFTADAREIGGGDWEIVFSRAAPEPEPTIGSAAEAVIWPDPVRSLDLTGLPPPEPMMRIFEELAALKPGEVLFALLIREPLPLLAELATTGHEWAGNYSEEHGAYRLLIRCGDGG